MRLVTVKIPEALLEDLDELVRIGLYPNRSSVIRAAVRDLVRRELWDRGGGSYRRALNSNRST